MDAIRPIMEIDYVKLITQLCLIIVGLNYFIPICKNLFCKILGIETKFQREKKEQKNLLEETVQKVTELSDKFNKASNNTDHLFEEKLVKFYTPYRQQSMDIQKDLKESIDLLTKADITRSEQIESLMIGTKELLGDTIDKKYEKYMLDAKISYNSAYGVANDKRLMHLNLSRQQTKNHLVLHPAQIQAESKTMLQRTIR